MLQKALAEATTPEEREEAEMELKEFMGDLNDFPGAKELQSMTDEELDPISSIFSDPRMYAHAINTFQQKQD